MNYDSYGRVVLSSQDLYHLLYQQPEMDLSRFVVEDPESFNASLAELHYDHKKLSKFIHKFEHIEDFDAEQQSHWYMPKSYLELDIAQWCIDQCTTEDQLNRVGEELVLYQNRNLFNLLRYLKYLVDTLRKHNIIWGVGRGSSVASYVLYLIGVHRIDSLRYNLDITEFLK